MKKARKGYDVIGLMHPTECPWYEDQDLIGQRIEVLRIHKCNRLHNWYYGSIVLVDPPNDKFDCIDNTLSIFAFRPRRVLK